MSPEHLNDWLVSKPSVTESCCRDSSIPILDYSDSSGPTG